LSPIRSGTPKLPQKVLRFLEREEGDTLDFKKEVSDSVKIAKTISAFSNKKGGTLLIGVDDEKRITGINDEEERYIINKAASEFCKPPVAVLCKTWNIGKKSILEVQVPEGDLKPYYSLNEDQRWMVYLRYQDETILASKVMVDVLKRRTQKANTLFKYSNVEQQLFDHLNKNSQISLKQFTQLAEISSRKARAILVNLITIGAITNQQNNGEEFYILSSVSN